jgi:hypothetical protein
VKEIVTLVRRADRCNAMSGDKRIAFRSFAGGIYIKALEMKGKEKKKVF